MASIPELVLASIVSVPSGEPLRASSGPAQSTAKAEKKRARVVALAPSLFHQPVAATDFGVAKRGSDRRWTDVEQWHIRCRRSVRATRTKGLRRTIRETNSFHESRTAAQRDETQVRPES